MFRYLDQPIAEDIQHKLVILTGPRQVGKTTLGKNLRARYPEWFASSQYLNYDILPDRAILAKHSWAANRDLLVLDELHKMPEWKPWLKGVADARAARASTAQQGKPAILVTGSARMDTFTQSGESLAGRYFHWRMHPLSVHELVQYATKEIAPDADSAMRRLLERGGFPEPCLAASPRTAHRWRQTYIEGLIREDIVEMSRIQEINTMRVFLQALRSRTGSPLSMASIARDMSVSPVTLRRYLEILEALYIVFQVRPWHRDVARATLQAPKVYFYDTGLIEGDAGAKFENLVACHLLKHVHWQQDSEGATTALHYIRTKDDAEIDFCLSDGEGDKATLTLLIECKTTDIKPHRALQRFATQWPRAQAVQLVANAAQDEDLAQEDSAVIRIRQAAPWLYLLGV